MMQGPLFLPEDVDRLAREDAEEDEAIQLAQLRFDELANRFSAETHLELKLRASKGAKWTRRSRQKELFAYEVKHTREIFAR